MLLYENKLRNILHLALTTKSSLSTCWLLFGADSGGVTLNLRRLIFTISTILEEKPEINRVELSKISTINELKSLLFAGSLFCKYKILILEYSSGDSIKIIPEILEIMEKTQHNNNLNSTYFILIAGELKKSNKLRQLFEYSNVFTALHCYKKDEKEISAYIEQFLKNKNIQPEYGLSAKIANLLCVDSLLIQNELNKLYSYCKAQNINNLSEMEALSVIAPDYQFEFNYLSYLVAENRLKNSSAIMTILDKARIVGINEISIIRVLQKYLTMLIKVKNHPNYRKDNQSVSKIISEMGFPLFGKHKEAFILLLNLKDTSDFMQLLKLLLYAEIKLKSLTYSNKNMFLAHILLDTITDISFDICIFLKK